MPNLGMQYSKRGLDLTEGFEGLSDTAYQDQGGVWTIGYGHTGRDVYSGLQITRIQAQILLMNDVSAAEDCVNENVTLDINQNEFDALTDFVFNCGCKAFESSTLLKYLNSGNLTAACHEFLRWDKCNGEVIAGLLRRREAEVNLFESDS